MKRWPRETPFAGAFGLVDAEDRPDDGRNEVAENAESKVPEPHDDGPDANGAEREVAARVCLDVPGDATRTGDLISHRFPRRRR